MDLGRISPDSFREIALFLDMESLLRLWSTQNKPMQKLLSTSGVVENLSLGDKDLEKNTVLRHFLRSLRDVRRVHIQRCNLFYLSHTRVPLQLSRLNPRSLVITDEGGDLPEANEGSLVEISEVVNLKLRLALPRLTHLEVRGASLRALALLLESSVETAPPTPEKSLDSASLPPSSLVSLVFTHIIDDVSEILAFPKTLVTLSCELTSSYHLKLLGAIWKHFECLEEITILNFPHDVSLDEAPLTPPKSLTSVHFQNLCTLPLKNLTRVSDVFGNNLANLSLDFNVVEWWNLLALSSNGTIDLQATPAALPSHITSMSVSYSWPGNSIVAPPGTRPSEILITSFWKTLTHLKSLTLKMTRTDARVRLSTQAEWLGCLSDYSNWLPSLFLPTNIGDLPPNITNLVLENLSRPLSRGMVSELPRSLVSLTAPRFHFDATSTFHERLPLCRLHLSKPVNFWTPEASVLATNFWSYWSPTLDFSGWANAMNASYDAANVFFKLSYEDPPTHIAMRNSDATELILPRTSPTPNDRNIYIDLLFQPCLLQAFPMITKLVLDVHSPTSKPLLFTTLPFSLTHLELNDTPLAAPLNLTSIRHLSSRATVNYEIIGAPAPSNLVHLDTPNWSFYGGSIVTWKLHDMDKLRMHVDDLADYNVIDFLTKVVNAKTRANMQVSISYCATSLLHEYGLQSLKNISIASIQAATDKFIRKRLLEPASSFGVGTVSVGFTSKFKFGTPKPSDEIADPSPKPEVETVGKVVTSLTLKPMNNALKPLITIPRFAKKVTIDYKDFGPLFRIGAVAASSFAPAGANRFLKRQFLRTEAVPVAAMTYQSLSALTPLELIGIEQEGDWLRFLPPTLLFLRLALPRLKSLLRNTSNTRFPPNLVTMVLETLPEFRTGLKDSLLFHFALLPTSLQHIAFIGGDELILCDEGLDGEGNFKHLINLKTFYMSTMQLSAASELCNSLPMDSLERFVCRSVIVPEQQAQKANLPNLLASVSFESTSYAWSSTSIPRHFNSLNDLLEAFPKLMVEEEGSTIIQDPSRIVSGTLAGILATGVPDYEEEAPTTSAPPPTKVPFGASSSPSATFGAFSPSSTLSSATAPVAGFGAPSSSSSSKPRAKAVRAPRK